MIAILSDLHLGLKGAPAPTELAPLLDGVQELILNGDASESGTPSLHERSQDSIAQLVSVAAAKGAQVTQLAGNHDPDAGLMSALRMNGALAMTHGHCFHPTIAPWSPHADEVGAEYRAAYEAASALAEPARTLHAASVAALHERSRDAAKNPMSELLWTAMRPWKMLEVIAFWRIFPELSARFLERWPSRTGGSGGTSPRPCVIASGHSHRAGAWVVRGQLVLNTGSFTFPGTPHAILIEGDEIVLVPLQRQRGCWRYLASVRRSWRIGEVARATADASTPVA